MRASALVAIPSAAATASVMILALGIFMWTLLLRWGSQYGETAVAFLGSHSISCEIRERPRAPARLSRRNPREVYVEEAIRLLHERMLLVSDEPGMDQD